MDKKDTVPHTVEKKIKKERQNVPKVIFQVSGLYARPSTIAFIIQLQGIFGLMIFSGLTNFNSPAVFLKSLHNFQINLNDRPGCQKYSHIHNITQHNGSLHQPQKAAAFLNSKLGKHHVITVILSTTGAVWK